MTQEELQAEVVRLSNQSYPVQAKVIIIGLIVAVLVGVGGFAWWQNGQHQQAVTMTETQMQDINVLQNKLNMSEQNAKAVKDYYDKALAGKVAPVNTFVVAAPTIDQAAGQVTDRINQKDPTLPPAALAPSDRTAVVSQPTNQQYQVGVYKINTYRNWEWSAGYGQHGGDRYIPVEVQRNFTKDRALSYEHHFGGKQSGFEVKYTVMTDKLFLLF